MAKLWTGVAEKINDMLVVLVRILQLSGTV